jgi:hypothetical protein
MRGSTAALSPPAAIKPRACPLLRLAQEVENFFVNVRRYILPGCHVGYWMGYRAEVWPKFIGLDKTIKNNTYSHYGSLNMTTKTGSYLAPEPNGKTAGEMCLLANQTQAYGSAFGWADANCQSQHIFMCRIMGAPRRVQCRWAQRCPILCTPSRTAGRLMCCFAHTLRRRAGRL